MTRVVCFQLVDLQGNPVTSVDAVECAGDFKVFGLRNAVKVKCSGTRLESATTSGLIQVFEDQAAYDAKQQPLGLLSLLTGLGKDEDNALIVELPIGWLVHCLRQGVSTRTFSLHAFFSIFFKPSNTIPTSKKDL